MTAPVSDVGTVAGTCTERTPCFVCRLKAAADAAGTGAEFSDAPFVANLVGCRQANSISNKFDDRMVVFFALPPESETDHLRALGVEDEVVSKLSEAVKGLKGGQEFSGEVRLVACARMRSPEGQTISGHRVVALLPMTTDPGLVRTTESRDAVRKTLIDLEGEDGQGGRLKALNDAKAELVDLLAKIPKGKVPPAQKEAVRQTRAKVDALGKTFQIAPTVKAFDAQIKKKEAARDVAKKTLEDWDKPVLLEGEGRRFKGYRGIFRTEAGWEGDFHALFPPGYHPDHFVMGQHHWSSDNGMPALTVGTFMGSRIVTGRVVKAAFASLMSKARELRIKEASDAAVARRKELREAQKKEKGSGVAAKHKLQVAELEAELAALMNTAKEEYVPLLEVVRSSGVATAGGRFVQACDLASAGGTTALRDDDEFVLAVKGAPRMSGRDIRLHFHGLAKWRPEDGIPVKEHIPAQPGAPVSTGARIVTRDVVLESLDARTAVSDDDVFKVETDVGGTNIHRGHPYKIEAGVVKPADSVNVGNWSTGCQVFGRFSAFDVFIRMAALSKRVQCLRSKQGQDCHVIRSASESAPEATTWEYARTEEDRTAAFETVIGDIKRTIKGLKEARQGEVKAWFEQHKEHKRPKDDAAACLYVLQAIEKRLGELAVGVPPLNSLPPSDPKVVERNSLERALHAIHEHSDKIVELEQLLSGMKADASVTYSAAKAAVESLGRWLDESFLPSCTHADVVTLGSSVKAAIPAAIQVLRSSCHHRSLRFQHDLFRTCDLRALCKQRFSYTLVESDGGSGRTFPSVSALDADFSRKVGGRDAHPAWKGF